MSYDWNAVDEFFNKKENADRLNGKLTKYITNNSKPYVNFSFSQRYRYRNKDFRLRISQDENHVHWLDIYFERAGQEKRGLRDTICRRLEDSRIHNWDFHLGNWDTENEISRKLVPNDREKINDLQWILDTMILIADNLQAIEAGESIVTDSGRKNTDDCPSANVKNNIPAQTGNTPVSVGRQTDVQMLPRCVSGKSVKDFLLFSLNLYGATMPVSKFASWACWTGATDSGDNTNLQFPCKKVDEEFLNTVNANIIFVGLNISRDIQEEWSNFHTSKNDARLRWAIQNNKLFWNAYMTDLIKGLPNSSSEYVNGYFQKEKPAQRYKKRYEGFFQKIKDRENQTFVSLKDHGDNFCDEMKLLESIQDKQKPIVLILLGKSMERDFLRPMFMKSGSFKKWKDELGGRLIVKSIQHYAARNRPGESETEFRERYCEELSAISNELSSRFPCLSKVQKAQN